MKIYLLIFIFLFVNLKAYSDDDFGKPKADPMDMLKDLDVIYQKKEEELKSNKKNTRNFFHDLVDDKKEDKVQDVVKNNSYGPPSRETIIVTNKLKEGFKKASQKIPPFEERKKKLLGPISKCDSIDFKVPSKFSVMLLVNAKPKNELFKVLDSLDEACERYNIRFQEAIVFGLEELDSDDLIQHQKKFESQMNLQDNDFERVAKSIIGVFDYISPSGYFEHRSGFEYQGRANTQEIASRYNCKHSPCWIVRHGDFEYKFDGLTNTRSFFDPTGNLIYLKDNKIGSSGADSKNNETQDFTSPYARVFLEPLGSKSYEVKGAVVSPSGVSLDTSKQASTFRRPYYRSFSDPKARRYR